MIRNAPRRILEGDEDDDEDDPYAYSEKETFEDDDEGAEDDRDVDVEADLDVLPTMLVYRAGELEHTWVRVDWEAGTAGIDDLLGR